jgi:MFS family permease
MSDDSSPTPTGVAARLPFDARGLLTPNVRRFYLSTLMGSFGNGLTLSLFVIYLTHVRGFPVFDATAVLAWEALIGLAISPLYGTIVDRVGPSPVLAVVMPVVAVGIMAIGTVSTVAGAFGVMTVVAVGGAGMWSSMMVLVTRLVSEERRQDAFGINFMLINLGIGAGALVGATVANVHNLRSFQLLYLACGVIMLFQAAVIFSLRSHGGPPKTPEHHHQRSEGWNVVLRDRRLLRFLAASMLLAICGYGQIEAGIQLYVVNVLHLPLRAVGLLFLFNTMTIVIAQIFVLGRIKGKSRSMLVGVVGAAWAASWLLASGSLIVGAAGAVVLLCLGQIVFALGETIWAPVAPALINDLAAEHLRGRYNSLTGVVWQVAGTIGPLYAGLFLTGNHGAAWTLSLTAGALIGGLAATTLKSRLTPFEDGIATAPPSDAHS